MTAETEAVIVGIMLGLVVVFTLPFLLNLVLKPQLWESSQALEFSVTRKFTPRLVDHFFLLFVAAVVVKDDIDNKHLFELSSSTLEFVLPLGLLCFGWHFVFRNLMGNAGYGQLDATIKSFANSRTSLFHSIVSVVACLVCIGTMFLVSELR
jgi:hypothetical protein